MQLEIHQKTVSLVSKGVIIEEIEKEIDKLNIKKASQNCDIPTRIAKENADIFADLLCKSTSAVVRSSVFPNSLNWPMSPPYN